MDQSVKTAISEIHEELTRFRHHLHRHPELGRQEYETTEFIVSTLQQYGLAPVKFKTVTGCYADIGDSKAGKIYALRADIDALPIVDEKTTDYSSKIHGKMHACGHDFHTTAALGSAIVLSRLKEHLPNPVRIIFQPAEEITPGGSNDIIKEGVINNTAAIIGFHSDNSMPPGTISVREGYMSSSADTFRIEIIGKGAHSSRPQEAVDPVYVAGRIIHFVYSGLLNKSDPRLPNTAAVCQIMGGSADNVIPGTCSLAGTVRAQDMAVRKANYEHLKNYLEGTEKSHGVTIRLDYVFGASAVFNNEKLTKLFKKFYRKNYSHKTLKESEVTMGGEDFGNFSERIPALFFRTGTGGKPEYEQPAHSSLFDVNDAAIGPTVDVISSFLLSGIPAKVEKK